MAGCHGELEGRVSEPFRPSFHKPERKADPMKRRPDKAIVRHPTQQPRLGQIGAVVGLLWVYEGANERAWQGLSRWIERPQHGRTAGAGHCGQVARLAVDKAHRQPGKGSAFHPVGGQSQLGGAGDAPGGQQAGQLL